MSGRRARWHYLAVVLDLFTRRVVGCTFSTHPDADLVVQALEMAHERRGRPQSLLFHSVESAQYASRNFRQRLWRYRIQQSMSRRGNCWDTQSKIRLERRTDLTRAGTGQAAFELTCRSGSGVPRALLGSPSVT